MLTKQEKLEAASKQKQLLMEIFSLFLLFISFITFVYVLIINFA